MTIGGERPERRWPNGRLGPDDDGELAIMVQDLGSTLVFRFATSTDWIGFDVEHAHLVRDVLTDFIERNSDHGGAE